MLPYTRTNYPADGLYYITARGHAYCKDGLFREAPEPDQIEVYRRLQDADQEILRLAALESLPAEVVMPGHTDTDGTVPDQVQRYQVTPQGGDDPFHCLTVEPLAYRYGVEPEDFDAVETRHENN